MPQRLSVVRLDPHETEALRAAVSGKLDDQLARALKAELRALSAPIAGLGASPDITHESLTAAQDALLRRAQIIAALPADNAARADAQRATESARQVIAAALDLLNQ